MDNVDRADEETRLMLQIHLANQRAKSAAVFTPPSEVRYCIDCGEPIPVERLQAMPNAVRCVACQTEHERNAQH